MENNSIFNSIIIDSEANFCYVSTSGHKYILMEGVAPIGQTPQNATYDLIFIIDSDFFIEGSVNDGFVGCMFGADAVNDPHSIAYIKYKVDHYEKELKL